MNKNLFIYIYYIVVWYTGIKAKYTYTNVLTCQWQPSSLHTKPKCSFSLSHLVRYICGCHGIVRSTQCASYSCTYKILYAVRLFGWWHKRRESRQFGNMWNSADSNRPAYRCRPCKQCERTLDWCARLMDTDAITGTRHTPLLRHAAQHTTPPANAGWQRHLRTIT